MSATVHKFDLTRGSWTEITVPAGAKPLHVDEQHGRIRLWMQVPVAIQGELPPVPMENRSFQLVPTGGIVEETWKYVGSVVEPGGFLVWHVYER